MKREITTKPVRYVINTHFHSDRIQGDHAYRLTGEKVDFIASAATGQLMANLAVARMKASVGEVPQQIDTLRDQAAHATSAGEKAFCADQIQQLQSYQAELKDFTPELPTITFDKSYLLKDPAYDLHIEFHGHATGDVIHGFLPNIADGFPRIWPGTIDSIGTADFNTILPGHAALQTGRTVMINLRNYIEELTGNVEQGKKAGLTLAEMQKRTTVASLKSLHSNGYKEYLARMSALSHSPFSKVDPLQADVNENVAQVYDNVDRT
jgi:cyclase